MPAGEQRTDAQLVNEALHSPDAFAPLVELYEAKLLRYIRRISGLQEGVCEDILQETFIKVYRNLNEYDPDLSFSSWVYRIAHNETINHIKKASSRSVVALEGDDAEVISLVEKLASDTDLEADMRNREDQNEVRRVISMLSPDFREVLVLRYLEEKDYREIGDILRKPIGTVGTLISRAKAQFKEIYSKNNPTPQ